jgi:transglutaminase-like putative cysteine protease
VTPSSTRTRQRHLDRVDLSASLLVSVVGICSLCGGLTGQLVTVGRATPLVAFLAGAGVSALALLGLESLSIRLVARSLLLASALLLVRFGIMAGSLATGGQAMLAWLVGATTVLVLTDRIGTEASPPVGGQAGIRGTRRGTARSAALVAVAAVVVVVLLSPIVLPHIGDSTQAGQGPRSEQQDSSGALRATDQLDMTTRPKLTDQVVFTVDADRATFWRGETFDQWDGRRWTRSSGAIRPLLRSGQISHAPDDLGAAGTDVVRQRVHIETDYADVIFAAASADRVQIDRVAAQRDDGTVLSLPLGRGATYTVESRRIPLTVGGLRAAGDRVPSGITDQYARLPKTTARVLAAARQVTRRATNDYDRIRALENWMGRRTEYSLDAPLAPKDVDVVDDFLFRSRRGWCEQIASSLVVLARANGIPARLVTGFVPGGRDPVSGTFTVRAKDAHAWAEVWFAGSGWVPFDPTADVPLAGDDTPKPTVAGWLANHAVVLLLGLAAVVLLVGPVRSVLARWWRARRHARRPLGWAAGADAALDRLGQRVGRARDPAETTSSYGAALATAYGDPRLAAAGAVIDDQLFAPVPPAEEVRDAVDSALAELAATPVPEQRPDLVSPG